MDAYKYFSPVTDITFRKVFGEHIDLTASLLNAFLPLGEGRVVTDLKYVTHELMPETPTRKNSLVDVRCEDSDGRTFLVEMQLNWYADFMQRVVFNTSKAYVKQLKKGENFELLQPVYSLNFVNFDLHKGLSEWYHPYQLVHLYHTNRVIEGLKIVFAEMEKYQKLPVKGNTKMDLWMRFHGNDGEDTPSGTRAPRRPRHRQGHRAVGDHQLYGGGDGAIRTVLGFCQRGGHLEAHRPPRWVERGNGERNRARA